MTLSMLLLGLAAAILPVCAWLACARVYQRKINLLQLQLKLARQTAIEHGDQARRQIGQLQAELASRPRPPRRPEGVEAAASPDRSAVIDRFETQDDGFPKTMIGPQGFMPTQLIG